MTLMPPKPVDSRLRPASALSTSEHECATRAGFRMTGRYMDASGLTLEFENDAVVLDCGKAHVRTPYTVDNTTNGFVVHVQNVGGAFVLGVAPDNTLRGSRLDEVNGKLVSSIRGGQRQLHSAFGELQRRRLRRQKQPEHHACLERVEPGGVLNVFIAHSVAASAVRRQRRRRRSILLLALPVSAVIFESSSARHFPGANPLAGQTVFVMRKPIGDVLRELGLTVPANSTAAQSMKALQTQCHSTQGCSSMIQGMRRSYVTTTKLDASGKAKLSARTPLATSLFSSRSFPTRVVRLSGISPANLVPGENTVTFSTKNAEDVR